MEVIQQITKSFAALTTTGELGIIAPENKTAKRIATVVVDAQFSRMFNNYK